MIRKTMGAKRQNGAVLAVALILLLVMTLLAVAALRGTLMQERMASGQLDRSYAFQSAEAALRAGEAAVRNDDVGTAGQNCITATAGCGVPTDTGIVTGCTGCWVSAGTGNVSSKAVGAPQYLIQRFASQSTAEALGLGNSAGSSNSGGDVSTFTTRAYYRVFARSHDPSTNTNRAVVLLSATYFTPLPGEGG